MDPDNLCLLQALSTPPFMAPRNPFPLVILLPMHLHPFNLCPMTFFVAESFNFRNRLPPGILCLKDFVDSIYHWEGKESKIDSFATSYPLPQGMIGLQVFSVCRHFFFFNILGLQESVAFKLPWPQGIHSPVASLASWNPLPLGILGFQ